VSVVYVEFRGGEEEVRGEVAKSAKDDSPGRAGFPSEKWKSESQAGAREGPCGYEYWAYDSSR
jgi:hypothetical protein